MLDNSNQSSAAPVGRVEDGGIEGRSTGGGADFFTGLGTMSSSRKEKEAVAEQVKEEEVCLYTGL